MRYTIILLAALFAAIAVACGGDGEEAPASTRTAATPTAATPTVEATPPPGQVQTGIPELDGIVEALWSGDPEDLRPLISFSKRTCVGFGLGLPLCGPGQPEGTLVDSFMVGLCEGVFYGPDQIDSIVDSLSDWRFYALYNRPAASALSYLPGVQYVAVVSHEGSSGVRSSKSVEIADGHIVQTANGCPPPIHPEQLVMALGLTDAVLPPTPDESTTPRAGEDEQHPAEAQLGLGEDAVAMEVAVLDRRYRRRGILRGSGAGHKHDREPESEKPRHANIAARPSGATSVAQSVAQQRIDRCLGAGAGVDTLDDHRAGQRRAGRAVGQRLAGE